ncbi:hypothetical protein OAS78_13665, partial [Pseudomonadales bacterium]|nr:hypothetical protein [Pseudomonadales bacterium]
WRETKASATLNRNLINDYQRWTLTHLSALAEKRLLAHAVSSADEKNLKRRALLQIMSPYLVRRS